MTQSAGEGRLFPTDLLESLIACEKKVQSAPGREKLEATRTFDELLRDFIEIFATILWPEFFDKKVVDAWGIGFQHPFFEGLMIELEQVYKHARKGRKFLLAEDGDTSIWILPDATLEIRFGGEKLTFPLSNDDYQDSMRQVSEVLQSNYEIARGLEVDPDIFIETVEKNNPVVEHMKRCLRDVIKLFVQAVTDFDMRVMGKFDIVEKMQQGGGEHLPPIRLTLISGPVRVLWEYRGSLYLLSGEGTELKAVKCKLAADDLVDELYELMSAHVEALYYEIPTDPEQLIQCLDAENPKESILSRLKQDTT